MDRRWNLAQFNIGRIVAPLDSEQLKGFVDRLEEVNAVADGSPGFVWRLQTDEGDATALRPYDDDDLMLVNMSVWESVGALSEFAYRSVHRDLLRERAQWFERASEPILVLWWVPTGHNPTVDEAKERLELLRAKGPTIDAFNFRQPFPPPGGQPG